MSKAKIKKERKQTIRRKAFEKKRNKARYARRRNVYSRDSIVWGFKFRDEKYVAKKLREGKVSSVATTGWGFFDRFYIFLWSIGFFDVLDNVEGRGYVRKMLTLTMLILTFSLKILIGISSLNSVPFLLFREIALMKLIGFTAMQIQEGICNRGKGKSRPMHKDTLGDLLERLTEDEVEYVLNSTARILIEKGFLKSSTFILDSTDLFTTPKTKGAGRKKYKEKKYDRRSKKLVEIEVIKYGFKLIVLQEAHSKIIVAAKFAKLNESEGKYTLSLIKQAEENMGGRRIKLLLIDRGFLDGVTLWRLKRHHGIDFITRVKSDMRIATDARSFRHLEPDGKSLFRRSRGRGEKRVEVVGISSLTSYDQYGDEEHKRKKYRKDFVGNPINASVVLCWNGEEYEEGHEPVFITSLKVDFPLDIIDKYDLRSLIENSCFRELKQGWNLTKYSKRSINGIRSQSLLTLTVYSLNAAFATERGKKLTKKGIRRLRTEDMYTLHKVVVFAEDYFGIFDIEEICIIVRAPPKEFYRVNPEEVKRRFGLKD